MQPRAPWRGPYGNANERCPWSYPVAGEVLMAGSSRWVTVVLALGMCLFLVAPVRTDEQEATAHYEAGRYAEAVLLGEPLAADQHVVQSVLAPVRVRLLHHQDRPPRRLRQPAAHRAPAVPHERRRTLRLEALAPAVQRRGRHAHQRRELRRR